MNTSEPDLQSALLHQNGTSSLDKELSGLHRLIESERRRARRLTIATLAVWITWLVLLTLGLGIPYVVARASGPVSHPTTQPSTTVISTGTNSTGTTEPPARAVPRAGGGSIIAAVFGIMVIAIFLSLPFVGLVLTIMMILARRSASMNQIRGSLASIDAQLRLLAIAQQNRGGPGA